MPSDRRPGRATADWLPKREVVGSLGAARAPRGVFDMHLLASGFPADRSAWAAALTLLFASTSSDAFASDRLTNVITRERVEAALPKIDEMAEKLVADHAVPGLSIAVVYEDEVVYLKAFGLREIGKPE